MERILTSPWFLASTAAACGLAVGLATWVAHDASGAGRAAAALIGLTATLAVMLLIAWGIASNGPATTADARPALQVVPPPEPFPVVATRPEAPSPLPGLLEEGRALRQELTPPHDSRVEAWIEKSARAIERSRPGVAGYFNALSGRAYPDDGEKLDAHLRRLGTIVRDLC